ncbi:putative dehydrodolichyl diphosphate synthetase [Suhomyces tanzawaensis NRRL Y-17324]|uniref:Alkyl transferase n=1 Tax=Suhomyces tanzawaensis NRRL Y-17324 TaxID=984487 RepID=A0A1E4SFL5_9ASCO|nr:putative dehydrodolichyl diphosphate synthetase [Suhomyces tanzawaensis NRRL Y-17324]ODV78260.1 putative dehydrodolichyl diphosphate synthetase [Suhomyces tanzawaensis NRRL Y-17324]
MSLFYLSWPLKQLWKAALSVKIFHYLVSLFKDGMIAVMRTGPVPKHIALIMDGNRRYAKTKQLPLEEGHSAGAESLVDVLNVCYKVGIEQVTVYAFSIENFNRPKQEVDTLFGLLRDKLRFLSQNEESFASQNKIIIRILGNRSMIPADILHDLEFVEAKTKDFDTKKVFNVCFPYTSRDEIAAAIRSVVEARKSEEITIDSLNASMYFGPNSPPLDILIRTSGHQRLSDFMLWQCNYNCTIEFVQTLWPDFGFYSITKILLKWSYYKALQLEEESFTGMKKNPTKHVSDILKLLPPPPPFASVNQR